MPSHEAAHELCTTAAFVLRNHAEAEETSMTDGLDDQSSKKSVYPTHSSKHGQAHLIVSSNCLNCQMNGVKPKCVDQPKIWNDKEIPKVQSKKKQQDEKQTVFTSKTLMANPAPAGASPHV